MAILVRCPDVACGRLTGWAYPSFDWAKSHVPGLPTRCFLHRSDASAATISSGMFAGMPRELCPDPLGHANAYLASRGAPPLAFETRYAEPEEEPEDPVEESDEGETFVDWFERLKQSGLA